MEETVTKQENAASEDQLIDFDGLEFDEESNDLVTEDDETVEPKGEDQTPKPEEDKKPEEKPSLEEEEEDEEPNPNVVAAYEFYRDRGYLPEVEEFDGKESTLQKLMVEAEQKRSNEVVENVLGMTPDYAKPLYALLFAKKDQLSPEELQEAIEITAHVGELPESIEDEESAEAFMMEVFRQEGDSIEEAEDRVSIYRNKGSLLEKANKYLSTYKEEQLSGINGEVQRTLEEEEDMQKQQAMFNKAFESSIHEMPWDMSVKKTVYQDFYSGNFKQRMETMLQDPRALIQLIDFSRHYDPESGINMEEWQKQSFGDGADKIKKNIQSYFNRNLNVAKNSNKEEEGEEISLDDYELID